MKLEEAKETLKRWGNGYCAIVRVRGKSAILPDKDIYGKEIKAGDLVFIDMFEKIDTGIYGSVYLIDGE